MNLAPELFQFFWFDTHSMRIEMILLCTAERRSAQISLHVVLQRAVRRRVIIAEYQLRQVHLSRV